jgi:hypothetical protein
LVRFFSPPFLNSPFLHCSILQHFSTCRFRSLLSGLRKTGLRHCTGVFSLYKQTRRTKLARSTTVLSAGAGGHIHPWRVILHNSRLSSEARSLWAPSTTCLDSRKLCNTQPSQPYLIRTARTGCGMLSKTRSDKACCLPRHVDP